MNYNYRYNLRSIGRQYYNSQVPFFLFSNNYSPFEVPHLQCYKYFS